MEALRAIGCTTHEYGTGTHELIGAATGTGPLPIRFDLELRIGSLADFLNPRSEDDVRGMIQCQGTFSAEGLVHDVPCRGTLDLRLATENRLRYDLRFTGPDGQDLLFVGEKVNVRLWNLYRTLFTCYGTIYDQSTGEAISRSTVYFYRSSPGFVTNLRLTA